jgi:hypothetical protein
VLQVGVDASIGVVVVVVVVVLAAVVVLHDGNVTNATVDDDFVTCICACWLWCLHFCC